MGDATGAEAGRPGSSSTLMPKSVARPASPDAYPCPIARNFHCPPRRYNSPPMNAVSVVASISKRANSRRVPASSSRSVSPDS